MNAIEFVKDKGLLFAIEVFQNSPDNFPEIVVDSDGVSYGIGLVPFVGGYHILRDDLKQVVEAFELVDQCGGLSKAKSELKLLMDSLSMGLYHGIEGTCAEMKIPRLKKAINLVEQCQ